MKTLGIRGATTVTRNDRDEILQETKILIDKIIKANKLNKDEIISIIFTMTRDLDAEYPSVAVRELLGITDIPLLNFEEKYVQGSMKNCIRVLIHINSELNKKDVRHVYLNEAKKLRVDLTCRSEEN